VGTHRNEPVSRRSRHRAVSRLAGSLLTLLVLPACAPHVPERAESAGVDSEPGPTTGITVFGDARIGVAID
jgi:hypothetical protein